MTQPRRARVAFQTHPRSQASSRGEAKDTALLLIPKGPHPVLAVPARWVVRFRALRDVSWKRTDWLGRPQSKGNKGKHKSRRGLFSPHSLALQRPGWWSGVRVHTHLPSIHLHLLPRQRHSVPPRHGPRAHASRLSCYSVGRPWLLSMPPSL